MTRTKTILFTAGLIILSATPAFAVTKTFTWTWPTQRTDNTALPPAQVGGIQLYDTSLPVPNLPGTVIPGCTVTLPVTAATGSCTADVILGHSFVVSVGDTATPANVSAPSNSVIAPAVLAPPKAITDLKVQ
jgi:hypothetical protein